MQIPVIYKDRDFLVLDKPAGIVVHRGAGAKVPILSARKHSHDIEDPRFCGSGKTGDEIGKKTLVDWLVKKYPEVKTIGDDPKNRPGIVHRLDKDTSGGMIVSRTQEAFETLKQLFKERKVEKTYLTLVVGVPEKRLGVISSPIGRSPRQPTKRAAGEHAHGSRTASTGYRLLERLGTYSLLEGKPKTGRMHQIRVHLTSIGHPVAGDTLYGGKKAAVKGLNHQFLHASSLGFSYPDGRRWRFEAALPENLDRVLKQLRRLRKRKNHAT